MSDGQLNSIKDKLRGISAQTGRRFNDLWNTLVLERFLGRVAKSEKRDDLILKGGTLLSKRLPLGRETLDIDFLIKKKDLSNEEVKALFQSLVVEKKPDDFNFALKNIKPINHELTNDPGFELSIKYEFGKANGSFSVDVGVGSFSREALTELPLLASKKGPLFEKAIMLKAYSLEMVFAEKYHTALYRGEKNSRMKDYHDMWLIASHEKDLNHGELKKCLSGVFKDRNTELTILPLPNGKALPELEVRWEQHRRVLTEEVRKALPEKLSELIKGVNQTVIRSLAKEKSHSLALKKGSKETEKAL